MRLAFSILFFLCLVLGHAQKKSDIVKIKLADLKAMKNVKELIATLPSECNVIECELIVKTKDNAIHIYGPHPPWPQSILYAAVGSKIYLDVIKFSCPRALKKDYKFLVIE